jgi:diguanylate cyclase (GGDEF)-like protein/PAS domain S-box-containing protein
VRSGEQETRAAFLEACMRRIGLVAGGAAVLRKLSAESPLSWLTYGAAALAAVALLFIFTLDEYRNWRSEEARSEQALTQAADALSRHVDDSVQIARVALGDLLTEFRNSQQDPKIGYKMRRMMLGQLASASLLESLSAIDAHGKLIAISTNSPPSDVNFTDRDYFRYHRASRDTMPFIALPTRSRLDGNWVMTVSRRIDDDKGNFAGVVVATFATSYFTSFFNSLDLGQDAALLMVRPDGIVLSRAPYDAALIGQDVSAHPFFRDVDINGGSGITHYLSPVDQISRVGAFRRSERTGIVVLTGASMANIFYRWADVGLLRWATMITVFLLSGLAMLGWVLQLRRRRLSEAQITARESEFRLLAEASTDLIQRLDLFGKRVYVSPASQQLLGIAPADLTGTHVIDGLDELSARAVSQALARLRAGSEIERAVVKRQLPDGRSIWLEATLKRVTHGTGSSVISVSRDITAYKLQHEQLEEMAHSDALTGLANRRVFDDRLNRLMEDTAAQGRGFSLLMIDVDRFKQFNDLYGHGAGDACLKSVADEIRRNLRHGTDLGVRYGGEEFAVVMAETDARRAAFCAERIRAAIEALAVAHAGNPPTSVVTVSIGIATWQEGEAKADLVARADACLYVAKHTGRNCIAADSSTSAPPRARFGT